MHGVNAVPKIDPYIPVTDKFDPQNSLNSEDMTNLKKWGMNFVRLGVMWEAVERTQNTYDMDYLTKIEALVNQLGEAGFHVLIDAHQDVGVRKLCGEGFPDFWAIDMEHECHYDPVLDKIWGGPCKPAAEYKWRYDSNGNPLIEDCKKTLFADYYHTPEATSVFDHLYSNYKGMQDAFIAYWDAVSKKFAGNKYILGYDPLNEPFASSLYSNPGVFLEDGRFDEQVLSPLYKRAFEKYHANDPTKIMFFEGTQGPDSV